MLQKKKQKMILWYNTSICRMKIIFCYQGVFNWPLYDVYNWDTRHWALHLEDIYYFFCPFDVTD